MPDLTVVKFSGGSLAEVANGLRALADQIDAGEFGPSPLIGWAADNGQSGLLGKTAEPRALAYLLFGMAQRHIEQTTKRE